MITQEQMLEHFRPILEELGKRYQKKSLIKAIKAIPGTRVVTKTSDGTETENIAEAGDWLVENQTSSSEQYLVKAETFAKKYSLSHSLGRGWSCYKPKGDVLGYQIQEADLKKLGGDPHVKFQAPWRDYMILKAGDFIVIPSEKEEIYRIAKKEFKETYEAS